MKRNSNDSEEAAKQAYIQELLKLFNSPSVPALIKGYFVNPADELAYWTAAIPRPEFEISDYEASDK